MDRGVAEGEARFDLSALVGEFVGGPPCSQDRAAQGITDHHPAERHDCPRLHREYPQPKDDPHGGDHRRGKSQNGDGEQARYLRGSVSYRPAGKYDHSRNPQP